MNKTVWIDLDNSPHVPLFQPVIKQLMMQNVKLCVTARDFAQTKALLDFWKLDYTLIGKHGGKAKLKKIVNLFVRTGQLISHIKKNKLKIDLAVSHGSRTQLVACKLLGIKSVLMLDYEYTEKHIFNSLSTWLLMPEYIPTKLLDSLGFTTSKIITYPGFKEELYIPNFAPLANFRQNVLGIDDDSILLTLRPSAMVGNYHDSRSEKIILELIKKAISTPNTKILIVSRTKEDKNYLTKHFGNKISFLEKAVDGLQLIWASDLFVSGGGTMNREAALMQVPVYSIFTGQKPYLDEYLASQNKLIFIDELDKLSSCEIKKRQITSIFEYKNKNLATWVANRIIELA